MTIGEQGKLDAFEYMQSLRKDVAKTFSLEENKLELSMGMTGDYEEAVIIYLCSIKNLYS